jgi:hypothetical protein
MTRTQFILRSEGGARVAFELSPDENAETVMRRLESAHRSRRRTVVRVIDPLTSQPTDYPVDTSGLAQVECVERD